MNGEVSAPRRVREGPWLALLLLAALALRTFALFRFPGFLSGDDVEILQEGARTALGLDYRPWSLRNTLLPRLTVDPMLRLGVFFGVDDTTSLLRMATVPFLLAATANGWLTHRIGRMLATPTVALVAAALQSFHWIPLAYGSTVYPRTVATTAVLSAVALLLSPGRDLARSLGAGALLALAFAFRYSEVLYLAPVVGLLWLRPFERHERRLRAAGLAMGVAVGALLTVGLYELADSGRFAGNLREFFRYTLVEGRASAAEAVQPAGWYLRRIAFWLPPTLLPFLLVGQRRPLARVVWPFVLWPLLVLSAIHHKDLRYLQGAVPFLALAAGLGLGWFLDGSRRHPRRWRAAAAVLLTVTLAFSLRTAHRRLDHGSQAAVEVARGLGADPSVRTVALSQPWAYGDRLYLSDERGILALGSPPEPNALRLAAQRADRIALYQDDLAARPELEELLEEAGFAGGKEVTVGGSPGVVVFGRDSRESPPGG